MARAGVYPGSFNPPTAAHLAVAEAAMVQRRLDRVALAHSRQVLGKRDVERPLFRHRVEVLEAVAAEHPWLEAVVTDHQLLVDIAAGYDVVIMGADKWHQIRDPAWYGHDTEARDAALARLPEPAIAPREGLSVPDRWRLELPATLTGGISSTAARDGRLELMAPAAQRFARRTGAWIDPDRYDRWLATGQ